MVNLTIVQRMYWRNCVKMITQMPKKKNLEFYTVNSFVIVVDNALILARLAFWSNCSINKAKTVIQGESLSCYGITIYFQWMRFEDAIIPLLNSVTVCVVDVVDRVFVYHA